MSAIDIVLFAIGLFFVARGLMRGFSGEVISLIGAAGGFFCSVRFYGPFDAILRVNFGFSQLPATITSMLAIFFLIFVGCALLEACVKKVISKTSLTFTDKIFGAFVGLFKMYVVAMMTMIVGVILTPAVGDEWMKNSRVITAATFSYPMVAPVLKQAGIPDAADIQRKARDYIMRQAEQAMTGVSADMFPNLGQLTPSCDLTGISVIKRIGTETSGDVTP